MKQIRKRKIRRTAAKTELSVYQLFHLPPVYHLPERTHKKELMFLLCARLKEAGYVTEDYRQIVLDREEITLTMLEFGAVILHGTVSCVYHPVIAAAISQRNQWTGAGEESGLDISSAIKFR